MPRSVGLRANFRVRTVRRPLDNDFCADLDAVVEVDHVGVVETKASRRNSVSDRLRLVCAVDAENGVSEIEGSRSKRIARTASHEPRADRAVGRSSPPARASPATPVFATPAPRPTIENQASDADAVADSLPVRLHEIEITIARIDNDRSGRLARMERDDLTGLGVGWPVLVRGRLLGRFGRRRLLPFSVFTATCCATAAAPKLVDASTAIAAASAPRSTKRDVDIIEFSRPLNGFGARQRRPSNDAALERCSMSVWSRDRVLTASVAAAV